MRLFQEYRKIALWGAGVFFLAVVSAFAAGITVPSGSELNVNSGNLNVPGDVTNDGTLRLTSGAISLTGNWTNTGTFTAGSGTVDLTGLNGSTQTLNSGGIGIGKLFYDLSHSGAGRAELLGNPVEISRNFSNSGGTFDAKGLAISLAGNWANTADFTHGGNIVTFGGSAAQTIDTGGSAFNTLIVTNSADYVTFNDAATTNNFIAQTPSSKIKFKEGAVFTVTGSLTLNGQAIGTEIELLSTANNIAWDFNTPASTASFVIVRDSHATHIITAASSMDLGNNINWIFGAVTRYWLGTANVNWNDPQNWSASSGGPPGADVPSAGDIAVFDSSGNNPCSINIPAVTLAALEMRAGYTRTLDANGQDINITATLTLTGGTLQLDPNSDLLVEGVLVVNGGTLNAQNGNIDANSSVSVSNGAFIAPGAGHSFNIAANFTHSGGIFTHSSGTVIFDTAASAVITGATGFYNLTCTTAAKQLTFTKSTTYTVYGTLNLNGQHAGTEIVLRSSENNSSYTMDFPNGPQTIIHVDLKDCIAATNASIARNSIDSAGNTNWIFQMVDPYGVAFDTLSDTPIKGAVVTLYYDNDPGPGRSWIPAVPGTHIAAVDVNPQTTVADGFFSYNSIDGDFYLSVVADGYNYPSAKSSFPAGRTIAIGSKGEVFTVSGGVLQIDQPMDSNNLFLKIKKEANKNNVAVGDIVTYTLTMENSTSNDVANVYLEDKIPAGFKYIKGKVILDNIALPDPSGNRPLIFNIGTIAAGQKKVLKYQLVVGSGVTFGSYENTAFAKFSDGTAASNRTSATVKVVPDPMFDLGTVIGKVFHDKNANGVQDKGEEPISNIQIVTEEGTLITADKEGKYHLAAISPGRHLFRLDERTLPGGAYLTTDKTVVVDITSGLLAKVNFGVKLKAETAALSGPFIISQQKGSTQPRLNVALYPEEMLKNSEQKLEPAQFMIFANYGLFIKKWELEILDKDTKALVRAFEGDGLSINRPVYWDGLDARGRDIKIDKSYVYVLAVTGRDNKQDLTKAKSIAIKAKTSEINKTEEEIIKEKQEWLDKESKINNLEKQRIKVDGETILMHNSALADGFTQQSPSSQKTQSTAHSVRIMKSGSLQGELEVIEPKGSTARELLAQPAGQEKSAGNQVVDIIVPRGEYDIEIIGGPPSVSQPGEKTLSVPISDKSNLSAGKQENKTYTRHIKVGEDSLFFVAMGDAKMGYSFSRGNIEPVRQDDKFKEGFWSEGKAAYYLKGKIKGKYLVTSSFDSDRQKKELFRNLDPNKYYPVYGDSASINYSATDTQGPLYLLVEWDKSQAVWGNYNTALTDTELAQFNRTLYGGRIYYEDVSTTQFGEPRTKLVVFSARAQQKAAHNEFVGTGGSLFYLMNKEVIEGSDKVRLEVRDKITGLVLAAKQMERNVEYEINYSEGRVIFWKPITRISESESIISAHLLGGNQVYVVADYEYETRDKYDQGIYGSRIQQSLTDYLRVGSTYVSESQLDKNYILKGTDAAAHLGKDVKFSAEYAQTESSALGSFVSTDGGLSFAELVTVDSAKGKAYGLKAEANLLGRLGLTAYYKQIEKNFSSSATASQQGKQLLGGSAVFDLTSQTRLKASHDIQKLIDDGNLQTQLQVGAGKTATTVAQITHAASDQLKFTSEYRGQRVTGKKEQLESETNAQEETVASKIDYKATPKINLSLQQQTTLKGAANNQAAAGITGQVSQNVQLKAKQVMGTQGLATGLGAAVNLKDKLELSAEHTIAENKTSSAAGATSVTAQAKVNEKTKVHTSFAQTDSLGGGKDQSVVYGSERKINDELTLNTDKSYAKNSDKLVRANTYGLAKEKNGRKVQGTVATQDSRSNTEISNSNIFGLSGDINDKWAGLLNLEKGKVQNLDGSRATRNAQSLGLSYVDKDKFKASSKLELRFDSGQADRNQVLTYTAAEGKINPNTTIFAKANISWTKNTTTDSTEARYKELSAGAAYRPVNLDRLNLLGKYTYLENNSPLAQSDFKDIQKEKSHILAGEAVYDLTPHWQIAEKLAYKMGEEKVSGFEFTKTQTWLSINRINYNISNDWQLGAEYRKLAQQQAQDSKQGVLVEVARKVGEFIQMGLGYNFTDFNDELTHLDYTAQGPFVRITGKFYDRTPEEVAAARQRWLETMIKKWAWELIEEELAHPGSEIMKVLGNYFCLAEKAHTEGKLKESKKLYEKTLQIGKMLYIEAREYVKKRVELEDKLKEDNRLAAAFYKANKRSEAKALWQKMIKDAEPESIYFDFR